MKTTIKAVLLIIIAGISFACSHEEDYNLSTSVFIEDTTNPGLPVYSEWGYNTFGAYIDRVKFISDNYSLPAKIIVNHDTLNLILNGIYRDNYTTMTFSLKGFSPKDYEELLILHDKKIDLKSSDVTITLGNPGFEEPALEVLEGELHFKRVQKLFVDKELSKSILSGTFTLKTFKNNKPIAISSGRFDFGIGYDNFYNY